MVELHGSAKVSLPCIGVLEHLLCKTRFVRGVSH